MAFTYQHIRDQVKQQVLANPMVCSPSHSVEWVTRFVKTLMPGSVLLDLGTFIGGSAHMFAKANPDIVIHTVDLNDFSPTNPDFGTVEYILESVKNRYNLPDLTPMDLYELQKMHLEDFSNIVSHTGHSRSIDIQNVSAVYVDASHIVVDVFADLEYAWERLLPNGYIFGDDANSSAVYSAFNKFALIHDLEMRVYCKSIMVQKKEPLPGFPKQTDGADLFYTFNDPV